jgi:membrane protein implicated in regulation of membrane protease activity
MHPFFEFVISILALFLVYRIAATLLQRKSQQRGDASAETVNTELRQRLEQMEERVRVLERIVTDERFDLKQQFKDLS